MIKRDATYIIGEIGQNHNGSLELAKLLIDLMAMPVTEELFGLQLAGIDAVKMTKRDLDNELAGSQMRAIYAGPHSFGRTYGEHRAFLELSNEEHLEAFAHAKRQGLQFIETLCAPSCCSLLELFTPDRLKVASRDLTNIPLLKALAETKIPIILSTGMCGQRELDEALNVVEKHHSAISILHCVSQYPTEPQNVNLNTIRFLKVHYPQYAIGYSDHTIGISTAVSAVALGAEIIEKHVTLDRRLRGTDQAGSLGPEGVSRMVRDIRLTDLALGEESMVVCDGTAAARRKLERSVASRRVIRAGEVISEEALTLLSPGDGVRWTERWKVIGKKAKDDIGKNEIIYGTMVE